MAWPVYRLETLCGSPDRIVVGVDNSTASVAALRWAATEAEIRNTHLHVVHCHAPDAPDSQADMQRLLEQALNVLPVDVESVSLPYPTHDALVAASHGAALLVVGTEQQDVREERSRFFGKREKSTARSTAAIATCPVAIVHAGQEPAVQFDGPELELSPLKGQRIVVGLEDSFSARDALRWAATEVLYRRAKMEDVGAATLHIVYADPAGPQVGVNWYVPAAVNPPSDLAREVFSAGPIMGRLQYLLDEVLSGPLAEVEPLFGLPGTGQVTTDLQLVQSVPLRALLEAAETSDLVVIGTHGYDKASDALGERVLNGLLRQAPCPVVVTPAAREDEQDEITGATWKMENEWATGVNMTDWVEGTPLGNPGVTIGQPSATPPLPSQPGGQQRGMYARVSAYEGGDPQDYDAGLQTLRTEVLPQLQGLPGYRSAVSLVDRATGRILSITYWDDEQALAASRDTVEAVQERAAASSGLRVLEVTEYEVGHTDLPTPPQVLPEAHRP